MRTGQGRIEWGNGKIKGHGTMPGSRKRFIGSAHMVMGWARSTMEFLATVPHFSPRRGKSGCCHGTVRQSAVNGGGDHAV